MVGQLLVAPPAQHDEYWEKSVIFIYEQTPASVVGLVLNKPSDKAVAQLAEHHKLDFAGDDMLYVGGPVNPASLIMLHTGDWTSNNTMHVTDNIMISSDRAMIQRLAKGDAPRKWKLFLGMSVWAPMQLEGEMKGQAPWNKKNAWITAPAVESILFGKDPERVWKRGIDLAAKEMVDSYFNIQ
jgi:putative transcriptional regulator